MPTHVACKAGVKSVLRQLMGGSLTLRLFKNSFTPAQTSVLGDFTEADFTGYSPFYPGTSPDADGYDGANNYQAEYDTITFGCTSTPMIGQTIYGWYITINLDATTDKVLLAHKFDTPVVVNTAGDSVIFNLLLVCGDLTTV